MIIKSHIRGGYRAAADYLKDVGKNEKIRLVEISDPDACNLDAAFHNMWTVASSTRAKKPLHHISINPFKDERLTDAQVLKIVARCEEKYGYRHGDHQRVIVEHILNGRQHFHVVWNRISLRTGRAIWPGHHWNKSRQAAREMEKELGLKRPLPRRVKKLWADAVRGGRVSKHVGRYRIFGISGPLPSFVPRPRPEQSRQQFIPPQYRRKRGDDEDDDKEKLPFRRPEWESAELLAWAWENGRVDILASFGIYVDLEP